MHDFSEYACVFCGQPMEVAVVHRYCSVQCATRQLAALGTLLESTPHCALSVLEWHELSRSYASDLELLNQVLPTLEQVKTKPRCNPVSGAAEQG